MTAMERFRSLAQVAIPGQQETVVLTCSTVGSSASAAIGTAQLLRRQCDRFAVVRDVGRMNGSFGGERIHTPPQSTLPRVLARRTHWIGPCRRPTHLRTGWGAIAKRLSLRKDGEIIGTYYIRANQAGGGKHICNCGYMTRAAATGRGVARTICLHSLELARQRGYRGM